MKQVFYIAASFVAGMVVAALLMHSSREKATTGEATVRTETVYDTIAYPYPIARDSLVVRYRTERLLIDSTVDAGREDNFITKNDSADVVIPITQKEYQDSTYHAWVSGYAVSLDSIHTYPRHDITIITEKGKPKRWHIGLTAGFGMTPKGVQPYIGVGITYSIKSF